jgi:uncharacterized protein (DUF305 family)
MARVLAAMAMFLAIGAARAADSPPPAMAMPAAPAGAGEMMAAMARMSAAMAAAPMTGNPDHDFAAMMVPHHQGAIDMAIFELDHGRDPKMRKLAASIVKAQENEIETMQVWLAQHAK